MVITVDIGIVDNRDQFGGHGTDDLWHPVDRVYIVVRGRYAVRAGEFHAQCWRTVFLG